ncbi:anti-sigma factor [Sphingomonas sp.]|uniref:anti-sigma factor family protein n=1 Tax=Sphingomonas sp. TaxID=28214 RepID=UPI00286B08E9|nr:anti-sigma factor [Sphingomonas sp.]
MTNDEEFYAWLDGELHGDKADEVAARVAADPVLVRLAEQHRSLGARLRDALAPVMEDAPPAPRFGGAEVVDLQARRETRRVSFGVPQWAAMAATLAIGIIVGQMVGSGSGGPIESRGGVLVAAASLDQALDARLASEGGDGPVRVGLSFRSQDGAICRSFTDEGTSGLACRADKHWRVEGLFAAPPGQSGEYRMAAGEDPRLAAMIDQRIAGEPFDAASEKAALDKGWR